MATHTIITISCAKDRGDKQDAIRNTWQRQAWACGYMHQFLLGAGNEKAGMDEWIVDADDSYAGISAKLRAAYKMAQGWNGYVFVSCIDTYIVPVRLRASEYWKHDYVGLRSAGEQHASGGNGYWLSPDALAALALLPPGNGYADLLDHNDLAAGGISLHDDQRYGASITKHLGKGTGVYEAKWMYDAHQKFLEQPL